MTKQFAFDVSIPDMIRKLGSRDKNIIDYLDTIVSRMYSPGAVIEINIDGEMITLASTSSMDSSFLDDLVARNSIALASVIPPAPEYETVEILSGDVRVFIDRIRNVKITGSVKNGSCVSINRCAESTKDELNRLTELYSGSDLEVFINGQAVSQGSPYAFAFNVQGFRGTVAFDSFSQGGLHFFYRGRRISSQPLVGAVDFNLHAHGLLPTITKSKIITTGTASEEYKRLQEALPVIFLDYLESEQVKNLRSASEASYQTLLYIDAIAFHKTEALEGILGVKVIAAPGEKFPSYDRRAKLLRVPNSILSIMNHRQPVETAVEVLRQLPAASTSADETLRMYERVVDYASK